MGSVLSAGGTAFPHAAGHFGETQMYDFATIVIISVLDYMQLLIDQVTC